MINMNNTFYVLKEGDEFYPQAFITQADEVGEFRVKEYKSKKGFNKSGNESIVKVTITEIK